MASVTASAFGDGVRRPARMCAAAASRAACEATFISSECGAPKTGGKRSSTSAVGCGIDMCTSYRCADSSLMRINDLAALAHCRRTAVPMTGRTEARRKAALPVPLCR